MPNIKSAKKRMKQSAQRRQRNFARKSLIKTAIRKVRDAIENKDSVTIKDLLKSAESIIARAAGKGVLHRGTASRKISSLARRAADFIRASA